MEINTLTRRSILNGARKDMEDGTSTSEREISGVSLWSEHYYNLCLGHNDGDSISSPSSNNVSPKFENWFCISILKTGSLKPQKANDQI